MASKSADNGTWPEPPPASGWPSLLSPAPLPEQAPRLKPSSVTASGRKLVIADTACRIGSKLPCRLLADAGCLSLSCKCPSAARRFLAVGPCGDGFAAIYQVGGKK